MKRPKEHVLEGESERALVNLLPSEWILRSKIPDYGLDKELEIVEGGKLANKVLWLQLKSTESKKRDQEIVSYRIETKYLKYYENCRLPVLILYWIKSENTFYYLFAQKYIRETLSKNKPNWREQKTVTIKFDSKLEKENIEDLKSIATDGYLYIIPQQLSTLPLGDRLYLASRGIAEGLDRGIKRKHKITTIIESQPGLKGEIKTEIPKGEPTLRDRIEEAIRTGEPFTIKPPQFKDLKIEEQPFLSGDMKNGILTIIPRFLPVRIIIPGTNVAFDDMLLRKVRTEGAIHYLSTEARNLPFVFEFAVDEKENKASCNFQFRPSNADVKQAFQYEEFVRALNLRKELRIVEPKENKAVLICRMHEGLEQSDFWYDIYSKLDYIQTKTKHVIPVPEKITKEDYTNIVNVVRTINTGEAEVIVHEVPLKINKQPAIELIEVIKKQGKISGLEISYSSSYGRIFNEDIPLGSSKVKLPDMQFVLPVKEIEKQVKAISEKDFIELTLKPVENNRITIRFENWLQKNQHA